MNCETLLINEFVCSIAYELMCFLYKKCCTAPAVSFCYMSFTKLWEYWCEWKIYLNFSGMLFSFFLRSSQSWWTNKQTNSEGKTNVIHNKKIIIFTHHIHARFLVLLRFSVFFLLSFIDLVQLAQSLLSSHSLAVSLSFLCPQTFGHARAVFLVKPASLLKR